MFNKKPVDYHLVALKIMEQAILGNCEIPPRPVEELAIIAEQLVKLLPTRNP
jgi:hypothetical protein